MLPVAIESELRQRLQLQYAQPPLHPHSQQQQIFDMMSGHGTANFNLYGQSIMDPSQHSMQLQQMVRTADVSTSSTVSAAQASASAPSSSRPSKGQNKKNSV